MTRIQQIGEILAGLEAEIGGLREELRRLESERKRVATTLTASLGANGTLLLDLGGESKTQFIRVPCSTQGAQIMLRILRAREESWNRDLGSEARPVQSQVQAWLKQADVALREAPKTNGASPLPSLSLEDLGI